MLIAKEYNNGIFIKYFFPFILLLLISPLFSILFLLIFSFRAPENHKELLIKLLAFGLSYYLSLILFTAELGGDLMNYKSLLKDSKFSSFFEFLSDERKEPVFTLYVYIMNWFLNGNFNLFVGVTIFIMYFFLFKSIIKISRKNLLSHYNQSIVLIYFAFLPFMFHLNGIIFRQNLALAIFIFAYSSFPIHSKKMLLISLIGALIHYIVLPIYIISILNKNLFRGKNLIILLLILIIVINFGYEILEYLASISESFRYLFLRLVRDDIYENADFSNARNMIVPNVTFAVLLIISVINILNKKDKFSFFYLKYAIVYIIVFFFVDHRVLEYRLLLINYFFVPFVLIEFAAFIRKEIKNKLFNFLLLMLPTYLLLFYFYINFRNEPNQYKQIINLLVNPFL